MLITQRRRLWQLPMVLRQVVGPEQWAVNRTHRATDGFIQAFSMPNLQEKIAPLKISTYGGGRTRYSPI